MVLFNRSLNNQEEQSSFITIKPINAKPSNHWVVSMNVWMNAQEAVCRVWNAEWLNKRCDRENMTMAAKRSINVVNKAVVTCACFAGGAASEGAVSAPSEAGGPGERAAAAAGGAGISGTEGTGPHTPARPLTTPHPTLNMHLKYGILSFFLNHTEDTSSVFIIMEALFISTFP